MQGKSTIIGLLGRLSLVPMLAVVVAVTSAPTRAAETWMLDPYSGCGTNNPFMVPGESIRWFGPCKDGKLDGNGTLIWYQGTAETQRNQGSFRAGEFHGPVVTTFPDGQVIRGTYLDGVRQGDFIIMRADGVKILARYDTGTLVSQRNLSQDEGAAELKNLARFQASNTPKAVAQPANPTAPLAQPQQAAQPVAVPQQTAASAVPQQTAVASPVPQLAYAQQAATVPSPVPQLSYAQPQQQVAAVRPQPVAQPPRNDSWYMSFFRAINPLTWFESDPAPAPALAAAPRPPVPAAARTPVYAAPAEPVQLASTAGYGRMYDMDALLRQPHPFAQQANPTSAIPVGVPAAAPRTYAAPQVYPTTPAPASLPPAYAAAPAPAPGYPAVAAPTQVAAMPVVAPAAAASQLAASRIQVADSLFAEGYRLERSGDVARAAEAYEQVVTLYPSAPSALIANERLNAVRLGDARLAAAAIVPNTSPSSSPSTPGNPDFGGGTGARIVALNSPYPATNAGTSPYATGQSMLPGVEASALISRNVCSRSDIYESSSKWCGIVRRDEGTYVIVEVRNVELKGFGTIGISRSECTGGIMLTWFSRGTSVRVPRQCLVMSS